MHSKWRWKRTAPFKLVIIRSVSNNQNKNISLSCLISSLTHWFDINYPDNYTNALMNQFGSHTWEGRLFQVDWKGGEKEWEWQRKNKKQRKRGRVESKSASTFVRLLLMSLGYYYPIMPQSPDSSLLVIVLLLWAKDGGNWRFTVDCYRGARIFFLLIHYSR